MGCMGLGLDDFCSCTPSEFWKTYEAWRDHSERVVRESWEETRVMCAAFLQPYSKTRLTGKEIFPLPWDQEEEKEEISEEERQARYEAAKKRYGI